MSRALFAQADALREFFATSPRRRRGTRPLANSGTRHESTNQISLRETQADSVVWEAPPLDEPYRLRPARMSRDRASAARGRPLATRSEAGTRHAGVERGRHRSPRVRSESARSVALAGVGLDSLVEIGASAVVLWELSGSGEQRQRRALWLIGGAFVAVALSIAVRQPWRSLRAITPDTASSASDGRR